MSVRFGLLAVLWLLAAIWNAVHGLREAQLSGFRYPIYACLPFAVTAAALSVGFVLAPQKVLSSAIVFLVIALVGFALPAIITAFAERRASRERPQQWRAWIETKANASAVRALLFYIGVRRGAA